jgi:hypothetical protein
MRKLTFKENSYFVDSKKEFRPFSVSYEIIQKALDFAYAMVFGEGHHRNYRSGGSIERKNGELFCNAFQGKMAEFLLHDLFTKRGLVCTDVDTSVSGKGIWDDCDLICNSKKINIKSCAYFSNLLLLETKDWDKWGNYIQNIDAQTSEYDYFVLVRIKPDIKKIFKENKFLLSNTLEKNKILGLLENETWQYDVAGWIDKTDLVQIINARLILPQGARLNAKTTVDANNYYIQSGDMKYLRDLIPMLKTNS